MAKPVTVMLETVLAALKLSLEPPSLHQLGPFPLKPAHWLFKEVVCCEGLLVAAKALFNP